MSGIWRKYPEKKLSDKNNERIEKLEKELSELKTKVHTVMEDQYLLEKSIKELKEQLRLEKDMRITNTKTMNSFLNSWCNRVKNGEKVLREFFEEMSFHYEVDGSRTNAAWMFFYDTLLKKLGGENEGVSQFTGTKGTQMTVQSADSKPPSKLSYEEFLKKIETSEVCPLCEYPYYDHDGTGYEYICRKTPSNQKLSSYHITEKGKRALELIDSLGGENSIKNKKLVEGQTADKPLRSIASPVVDSKPSNKCVDYCGDCEEHEMDKCPFLKVNHMWGGIPTQYIEKKPPIDLLKIDKEFKGKK